MILSDLLKVIDRQQVIMVRKVGKKMLLFGGKSSECKITGEVDYIAAFNINYMSIYLKDNDE